MEKGKLPNNWTWSTLGEATQINPRDISLRALPDDLTVTFLPMAAVDAWQGIIAEPEIRPLKSVRKGFTAFSDGDVLFAKITPSMENGKAAIAKKLENGIGFGSTEFHVFRPKENVTANWIFHFIRQEHFRKDAKAHFAGTAGQLRVPASFLLDYPIPIPPLPEQERIVAKIEELFTQLDAGTSALAKVQAGLRRYKMSVLKAAVSGRLVNGNLGVDEGELPEGWQWVKFADLISKFRSGSTAVPKHIPTDYPILRSSSVRPLNIDYTDIRYFSQENSQNPSNFLKYGDLLFTRLSGSLDYVGNCAMVRNKEANKIQYPDRIFCAQLNNIDYAEFLEIWFAAPKARRKIMDLAKSTAGHQRISMGDISGQSVPFPPLEEQRRIVAEVERRLSVARQVESSVEEALMRAARLRQAVLRSAFEGRLVS